MVWSGSHTRGMTRTVEMVGLVCVMLSLSQVPALADEPTQGQVSADREVKRLVIRQETPLSLLATCEVVLSVGDDHELEFELVNGTSEEVFLNNPETSCGCISVSADETSIQPGESCTLKIKLRPDGNYADHVWQQRISFRPPEGKSGRIANLEITSKLRGIFTFTPSSLVLIASTENDDPEAAVEGAFDVTYSEPTDPGNFIISGSEIVNLLDINIERSEEPGKARITVQVESSDIPEFGMHGRIDINDEKTGEFRVARVSMIRRSPIRVVPSTIVFRRSPEGEKYLAHAILIRESSQEPQSEPASSAEVQASGSDAAVFCDARMGDHRLDVEVVGDAKNFRRLRLSVPTEGIEDVEIESVPSTVSWEIHWSSSRIDVESSVLFPTSIP